MMDSRIKNLNLQGFFMEPQNFSVNDGNGIRTVIFMAGCPLRCKWCSNPESQILLDFDLEHNEFIKVYTVKEIMNIISRQQIFYRYSGGGVTFSGGEATCQTEMLIELTNRLHDKAIDLAIETSGYFELEALLETFKKMDLIFIDIKLMDEKRHIEFTGKSNKTILKNIKKLGGLGLPIVIRIPVIEGVNADAEDIIETAKFVFENIKKPRIELLPYHFFGDEKYAALNRELPSRSFKTPSKRKIQELSGLVKSQGVEIVNY